MWNQKKYPAYLVLSEASIGCLCVTSSPSASKIAFFSCKCWNSAPTRWPVAGPSGSIWCPVLLIASPPPPPPPSSHIQDSSSSCTSYFEGSRIWPLRLKDEPRQGFLEENFSEESGQFAFLRFGNLTSDNFCLFFLSGISSIGHLVGVRTKCFIEI